jgi:hypothetical protein
MAEYPIHGMGRVKSPEDSRDFNLARFMLLMPNSLRCISPRRLRMKPDIEWMTDIVLDQGETPHCVGFSFAGYGNTLPVDADLVNANAHQLYYDAKKHDGDPGSENGSTIRSGAKAYQDTGRMRTYAFARALDEIKAWVVNNGSVVVGTVWRSDMSEPDRETGLVKCTGPVVGGHAYLLTGYSALTGRFTFLNSWGAGWGRYGRFRVDADEWWDLFSSDGDGEAMVALEIPLGMAKKLAWGKT